MESIDNKQLQVVAISAKIVELEERHPDQVDEIKRLKDELKALRHQIEPSKEVTDETY